MPMPATSQAFHKFQWAPEVVQARVTLSMPTKPTANDTITIGGRVYTYVVTPAVAGDVAIGALVANSQANLIAAVNDGDTFNVPNLDARISPFNTGNDAILFARNPGTGGNSLASTETFTAAGNVFSSATFLTGAGTRGTDLPATSIMVLEDLKLEPTDALYVPKLAKGLLIANRGNEQVIARGTKWSVPDGPASFEQFINWLSMITANYTYVVVGGIPTWVFEWRLKGSPEPNAFTLEREISDGDTPIDYGFHYAMLEKLDLKTAQDQPVKFGAAGFARRIQTETMTAGLSPLTPEIPSSAQLTVYIDDTWGTLGATAISSVIYQSDVSLMTGYMPLKTSPGRTDRDFGTFMVDSGKVGAEVKMLALVTNGLFVAEKAKAEAAALRAIRWQIDGTGSRSIKLDLLMKHKAGSVFSLQEFNGSDVVNLDLQGSTDDTHFMRCTVACPGVTAIL